MAVKDVSKQRQDADGDDWGGGGGGGKDEVAAVLLRLVSMMVLVAAAGDDRGFMHGCRVRSGIFTSFGTC